MPRTELLLNFSSPLSALGAISPRFIESLRKIDVSSVGDLVTHLPLRYLDCATLSDLGHLTENRAVASIVIIKRISFSPRSMRLEVQNCEAPQHSLSLFFMHYRAFKDRLQVGQTLYIYGKPVQNRAGWSMVHPLWRVLHDADAWQPEMTLTAVYPTTSGVTQTFWRHWIKVALERLSQNDNLDLLPSAWLKKHELLPMLEALKLLHFPPIGVLTKEVPSDKLVPQTICAAALTRLAVEELLAHYLSHQQYRAKVKRFSARPLVWDETWEQNWLSALPFSLTGAQKRVLNEIKNDCRQAKPMLRLLQGDVGSGKTVVAALALAQAAREGYQAAIMAPTALLAKQHYQNLVRWFGQELPIELVTSELTKVQRRELNKRLAEDRGYVIAGTHALFQESISLDRLGLVAIDEQHRFGVAQRMLLRDKSVSQALGQLPHQLIMTATPIPRTLAMSFYGDLNVSRIDEYPSGRVPIKTSLLSNARRLEAMERLAAVCQTGQQAYWVCPLIDESDDLEQLDVKQVEALFRKHCPQLRVAILHGRLSEKAKALVMQQFLEHQLDVLIATTVVEVGVDVPSATIMVIENAERFGLTQLHQLRGRVGRGNLASYCLLLYQAPLSPLARQRLETICGLRDGFALAKEDLKLRGTGDHFGTRQTGESNLRVASFLDGDSYLPAFQELLKDPMFTADLANQIIRRWLSVQLEYGSVA